ILEACQRALDATDHITVATGILNVWRHDAAEVATTSNGLGPRFLLGLGVSHSALIGEDYRSPLRVMTDYLDALDAAGHPAHQRVLAALGPKMLRLAADRTAGTHPYFVPVEHTPVARAAVGPDRLVAPEMAVVLERDPTTARGIARQFMALYLGLPNYTNNVLQCGFTEADLADGGSDRLVDAIVAWGSEEAIAERIAAHRAAGADHVCLQVLGGENDRPPMAALRTLAPVVAQV
ncbi:MAG: hypothetical protein JWL70_2761, partial [Acidimicrobiia bacterium]|nr:hypothetical protein [Acidimicrobiia bacterium]